THGEQVCQGDVALGAVWNGREVAREERADRLVNRRQIAGIERDPDQRGEHAFGDGLNVVQVVGRGAMLVFVVYQIAAAHDQQAVEVRVCGVEVCAQSLDGGGVDVVIGGRGDGALVGGPVIAVARGARVRGGGGW